MRRAYFEVTAFYPFLPQEDFYLCSMLKYHQCVMLLFRPSSQIPHPTPQVVQLCFTSAMKIIRVYIDLHKFSNMECSWLSAQSVFVAVNSMLYCLWVCQDARGSVPHTTVPDRAEQALKLLAFLGETWSVAQGSSTEAVETRCLHH